MSPQDVLIGEDALIDTCTMHRDSSQAAKLQANHEGSSEDKVGEVRLITSCSLLRVHHVL